MLEPGRHRSHARLQAPIRAAAAASAVSRLTFAATSSGTHAAAPQPLRPDPDGTGPRQTTQRFPFAAVLKKVLIEPFAAEPPVLPTGTEAVSEYACHECDGNAGGL